MTDDELLSLYEARDEAALEHTAAQYGERLTRLCVRFRRRHRRRRLHPRHSKLSPFL